MGNIIFEVGSEPEYFYLIGSGKLKVTMQGRFIRLLEEGDFFGEIALINNIKRTATVTCLTECELYLIPQDSFDVVLDKQVMEFLRKCIEIIHL